MKEEKLDSQWAYTRLCNAGTASRSEAKRNKIIKEMVRCALLEESCIHVASRALHFMSIVQSKAMRSLLLRLIKETIELNEKGKDATH